MPLSPMKSLCTDGNSDSVGMLCASMILELQPWNAWEHQCPSIDPVFEKWVSVAVTSFNLGWAKHLNLDLMCLLKGNLMICLASWVVLIDVCLMLSFPGEQNGDSAFHNQCWWALLCASVGERLACSWCQAIIQKSSHWTPQVSKIPQCW